MRADVYLTANGHVPSRRRAQELIEQGLVCIDGTPVKKPSLTLTDCAHTVTITQGDLFRFVSRGGEKLEGALEQFGIDVGGMVALDIGASTGGFTDCLLQRGAAHVIALDAGVGQLAQVLQEDPRVTSMEKINARELSLDLIGGERVDLIVMDVSFISATYILPHYAELLKPTGQAVCLIKPQFEVGKAALGKGGIVKDPAEHQRAIERVRACAEQNGLTVTNVIPSPIVGGDGNKEFLAHLTVRTQTDVDSADVSQERTGVACQRSH